MSPLIKVNVYGYIARVTCKKLAAQRAHSGRREIPEDKWRDACTLSQTMGIGAAGKLLGLNSVRIKYWASQFGVEIPSRIEIKRC